MKKLVLFLLIVLVGLWAVVHKTSRETIVIYSAMEQYRNDDLQTQLAKRFPNLSIQIMYLPTAKIAAKVRVEKTETDADILLGVETGYLEMVKDSLAEVTHLSRLEYLDGMNPEHGKYLIWESYGAGIAVNTQMLEKHGLPEPKTYDDLKKPMYRNLIALQDPKSSSTGYNVYLNLRNTRGLQATLDFYDTLNPNVKLYSESSSGPVKLLIQGEIVAGTALTYQIVTEINKGNPLKMIYPPEGSPYSLDGTTMISGRESSPAIRKVFEFIVNDVLVYDKEHYNPGRILKSQSRTLPNFPKNIRYADMTDLHNLDVKKELLSRWKY